MKPYHYGSTVRSTLSVQGTVTRGRVSAGTRKGQTFTANGRTVIENRVEGKIRDFTVLDSNGRAEARIAADSIVF